MTTQPASDSLGAGDDRARLQVLPAWLRAALWAVIVAALALRFAWPGTTVFCEDQARACALAQDIAGGRRPAAGLVNSGEFRNLPGFAYLLAGVWAVRPNPMALLIFTNAVNALAVLGAIWLARRWIGPAGAAWTGAFLASAPWAIHYSRWIWAQDMLFPAALLVYASLWQWIARGRAWAVMAVVLGLTLLVQIHLAGVVLIVATVLLVIWCRPRIPLVPLLLGAAVAAITVLPYLLSGGLAAPTSNRLGYQHFWRVLPGAAMSVTGLGWSLEFKEGYPAFAQFLQWRRWAYELVMVVPVLLLGAGIVLGLLRIRATRREGVAARRTPLAMAAALAVLIPAGFILLGLRTSPSYLPMWYPLPFVLMGWFAARLTVRPGGPGSRAWPAACLLLVLVVQMAFFIEQARYIRANGGVPGSQIGRDYQAALADAGAAAGRIDASEVWMVYDGPSPIQKETAAYLLRRSQWKGDSPRRVLMHFAWGPSPAGGAETVQELPGGAAAPPEAWLVKPWTGPQQRNARIPQRP